MYIIPSKAACLTLMGRLKISVAQLRELIIEDKLYSLHCSF